MCSHILMVKLLKAGHGSHGTCIYLEAKGVLFCSFQWLSDSVWLSLRCSLLTHVVESKCSPLMFFYLDQIIPVHFYSLEFNWFGGLCQYFGDLPSTTHRYELRLYVYFYIGIHVHVNCSYCYGTSCAEIVGLLLKNTSLLSGHHA